MLVKVLSTIRMHSFGRIRIRIWIRIRIYNGRSLGSGCTKGTRFDYVGYDDSRHEIATSLVSRNKSTTWSPHVVQLQLSLLHELTDDSALLEVTSSDDDETISSSIDSYFEGIVPLNSLSDFRSHFRKSVARETHPLQP